jgi:hypothetical protein
MIRRILTVWLAVLAASGLVGAAPTGTPPRPLTLTPAAAPVPALKCSLALPVFEQKPGNAAPLYRAAGQKLKELSPLLNDPGWQYPFKWMQLPIERQRARVKEARAYIEPIAPAYEAVETAARCEFCDWGVREELSNEPYKISYEDAQRVRGLAFFLEFRCCVALADDRPEDAVRDARTLLTLAHHLNQAPTLIHALVAAALGNIGAAMIEKIVEHPQAPNLYWALADLPRPFISLRPALEGDRLTMFSTFPGLAVAATDPNAGPLPPARVERFGEILTEQGFITLSLPRNALPPFVLRIPGAEKAVRRSSEWAGTLYFGEEVVRRHEAAKRALIATGRPRDKVEKMPPLQVALLHSGLEVERVLDEARKWQSFPYWQSAPALAELKRRLDRSQSLLPDAPALPLGRMLMPVLSKTTFARGRLERHLAALQCVEAIRLYAATHEGRLPPSLSAIKEVPIPIDPMTGRAFDYQQDADRATLCAEVLPIDYAPVVPRYEVRLRR